MHFTADRLDRLQRSLELALSDYLHDAVHNQIAADPAFKVISDGTQWLEDRLGEEIEAVLRQHNARPGYATLAGVARPVGVLRQAQIKLEKGKGVRSEAVEVLERI